MKILWYSDSPFMPSAYGDQTRMLMGAIKELGHDITVFCPQHGGAPLTHNGVRILGGRIEIFGNDILMAHVESVKPDVLITMKDPYCFMPQILNLLPCPWVPFVPVDTLDVCKANTDRLHFSYRTLSPSQHGVDALRRAGYVDALYTPHGIDMNDYKPGSKQEAREALGLPQDVFVTAVVGANMSKPSRKNLDVCLAAWSAFIEDNPDDIMLLHSNAAPDHHGLDLGLCIEVLGIPEYNVWLSDQYKYNEGFSRTYMANIYKAADVLLNPSGGEGFGLCVLEAQACGTPVITSGYTAMQELTWSGIMLDEESNGGEIVPTDHGGRWFRPYQKAIRTSLVAAKQMRDNEESAKAAYTNAQRFEFNYVVDQYWKPALETIERELEGETL